ncbi:MAG TPA: hypothetical protein VKQ28_05185 [Candidatus Acidoferrum sp.]|nr:hypothetical protein [Candidatus Acidoferrum sp.]
MSATSPVKESIETAALKVWRYPIPATPRTKPDEGFTVKMPAGALIVDVRRGSQSGEIFAWVNPRMAEETRYFVAAKTNFPLPSPEPDFAKMLYVGSWDGYGETWHLFELKKEREPGEEG